MLFRRSTKSEAREAAGPQAGVPGQAETLLRRLEWTVIRRLDGLLQGDYRTLMRGAGLDLADLREYQLHDDVRHIDWNVTARVQVPHVRVFTEDREMAAWFLLDLSASVDFGSGDQTKRQLATEFTAVLARLLTRHGNRVGALMYGTQVDGMLPARSGRRHVLQLLHQMSTHGGESAASPGSVTRLRDLLLAGAHAIRRRSTVFVVSDFISEPGWEDALAQLAQRHEVVAVRLLDPLEVSLPDIGLVPLRDAETGDLLWVDTANPSFRARFERVAAGNEARLHAALGASGVDALELLTDGDLVDALMRFTEMRQRRLQRRGAQGAARTTHLQTLNPQALTKEAA